MVSRAVARRRSPESDDDGPARCAQDQRVQQRILVIANRTPSTPRLLHEIGERAAAGATFTVLIPPDHGHHSDWSPEVALELVGGAAGADVAIMASGEDPLDTVHR